MSDVETVVVKRSEEPGESKPWEVVLENVGVLGTARAALNHPRRNFDTREEAESVAEEIKELIKAEDVSVLDDDLERDRLGEGHRTDVDHDVSRTRVEDIDTTSSGPNPLQDYHTIEDVNRQEAPVYRTDSVDGTHGVDKNDVRPAL